MPFIGVTPTIAPSMVIDDLMASARYVSSTETMAILGVTRSDVMQGVSENRIPAVPIDTAKLLGISKRGNP
jgi:hypothetical protein